MTISKVENADDQNDMTYHLHVETPTFAVYNRSMFVTYYVERDFETGVVSINSSSKGTDKLVES